MRQVLALLLLALPSFATGTASFVKYDLATKGSWSGVYGSDGYNVAQQTSSIPAYATVTISGNSNYNPGNTTDVRGLQIPGNLTSHSQGV